MSPPELSPAALDFRFGWLWLLPFAPGRETVVAGFDETEAAFLHGRFTELQEADASVDGWVVDADNGAAAPPTAGTAPAWLAVVGSGSAVARWKHQLEGVFDRVREYALLPARAPRVVVPLHDVRHTLLGLALHRPGRRFARLGIAAAAAACRAGTTLPLRRRVLLIATRAGAAHPKAAHPVAPAADDFALYLGSADERRKTVVLPLAATLPTVILKTATMAAARRALAGEAATLTYLAGTPLADHVPRLLARTDDAHATTLSLEYRPRIACPPVKLEAAVREFLCCLSSLDRRDRALADALAELAAADAELAAGRPTTIAGRVFKWLHETAATGAMLAEHRAHGDFAPWNCAWTSGGLFVFDWEDSSAHAAAFSDAFYFRLAPYCHVAARPHAAKALESALALAVDLAPAAAADPATAPAALACWLLQRRRTLPRSDALLAAFAERFL